MTDPVACSVDPRHQLAEHERGACTTCTGRARADLHAIDNASTHLQSILYAGPGSNAPSDRARSNDGHPLPGGDALVLLAGGGDARGALRRLIDADRTGRPHNEPAFGIDDLPGDPLSLGWELGRWEDDWRRIRHEPAATHSYATPGALSYLLEHLGWAGARHPDFPDFTTDIANLRHRVEAATGTAESPVRADAPCIDCGEQLQRRYREATKGRDQDHWGLEDDWTCAGCRRRYTDKDYARAIAQMLYAKAHQGDEQEAAG